MCGICGFIKFSEPYQAPSVIKNMTLALQHRGPDGLETWLNAKGTVGLGHTRLAIIDIEGGKQPLTSSDGNFLIVFNGEIYNFRDLRKELIDLGYQFRTRSDTEVLLNAFLYWGKDCLLRFNGMFAFAVYDSKNNVLFLGRDRTGIKPLYYYFGPQGFLFASELKSILSHGAIPRRLNYQALADFLVLGYPVAPKTFFADCFELEPGTWMQVSKDGIQKGRYWEWERKEESWDRKEVLQKSEDALVESLREHLVSDVPIGAFLSGGIDSSILVALLSKRLGVELQTFTVKFGETSYDESSFARRVAEQYHTRHREIIIENNAANIDLAGIVIDQFDQPFGDSSAIPTYLISQEIRKYVKVAIGGDGGDEMFGGYPRFFYADIARNLNKILFLTPCVPLLKSFFPEIYRQMVRLFKGAEKKDDERLIVLSAYTYPEHLSEALLTDIMEMEKMTLYRPTFGSFENPSGQEFVDATVRFALPGDYLRKIDCMSSSHGLEVRVPYLGNQVLDFAQKLPHRFRYRWTTNKILLRALAKMYLPKEVVEKPKGGFGIPLDSWLGEKARKELREILTSSLSRIRDLIRPQYIHSITENFVNQKWNRAKMSRFMLYQKVYFLWALERWLTKWHPTL